VKKLFGLPTLKPIKNVFFLVILFSFSFQFILVNSTFDMTIFYEPFEQNFETLVAGGIWEQGLSWGDDPYIGSAQISNDYVNNGSNSLKIISSSTFPSDSVVAHNLQPNDPVVISGWFYDTNTQVNGVTSVIAISKGDVGGSESYTHMLTAGIIQGEKYVYQYRDDSAVQSQYDTSVMRTNGWHEITFRINSVQTEILINKISVYNSTYITHLDVKYIIIGDFWNTGNTMYFDDISVKNDSIPITSSQNLDPQNKESSVFSCLGTVNAYVERPFGCTADEWTAISVVGGIFLGILGFAWKFVFRRKKNK
jgi:hypothetical protein